MIDLY
jgi:GST-like protein